MMDTTTMDERSEQSTQKKAKRKKDRPARLTAEEERVFCAIVGMIREEPTRRGITYRRIAKRIGMWPGSVFNHCDKLRDKHGVLDFKPRGLWDVDLTERGQITFDKINAKRHDGDAADT